MFLPGVCPRAPRCECTLFVYVPSYGRSTGSCGTSIGHQIMPFELSDAPTNFQGYVNKILAEKLDMFVVIYLGNILIYMKDPG